MGDESNRDINPQTLIEGEGKKVAIVVRPILTELGQKPETIPGEPETLMRAGQKRGQIHTGTIWEQAEAYINHTAEKAEKGEAIVDGEIAGFSKITDKLTQKGKDGGKGLRLDMAGMIVKVNDNDPKNTALDWKDLSDPKKAEGVRKKNTGMGLLYDYIKEFGGDPAKLDWQIVVTYGRALTESYNNRGKQIDKKTLESLVGATTMTDTEKKELYQKLLARESYSEARPKNKKDNRKWKDNEEREKVFDRLLGVRQPEATVNPVAFLERQFYERAVKPRLEAMRAPTIARLAKDGKKMEIVQTWWEKHVKKTRLTSRLSFEILDPGSELGKFLNALGELDFWKGKAAIDRQRSLYTGIPIESEEARAARPAGEGLFSVLNKDNVNAAEVSECCGPEAELQISKDDKVCDALNILYHLAEGKTYQQSLEELKAFFKEKYKIDIDLKKELPSYVKDAVMIAYFYGLDIRANGNKDARYKSWLVGEFENLAWVTDVNGNRINLLGDAFALKSDDMVERGWFSGRNASLAYNAISGDPNDYNPDKLAYQRIAKWQYVFFYTLGLDRDNRRVRHYEVDPNVEGDNILPGTMGKFEHFDNFNRDHRRALFDRLTKVAGEDFVENKPYWDKELRDRVNRVLNFYTNSRSNRLGTNNEVWFDPATMDQLPIWNDINLVLEDPRSWGIVPDFREEEMQHRTQTTRYTMHNSLMYDCAAVESAAKMKELLNKIPNTLVEEFDTFPAQISQAALEMKHRYNSELTFRNLNTLFEAASRLAIERFLQVQIPNRELIQKMLSEYKLFEWRRIFEGIKGLPINGKIERSAGIEFFLRQIEEELDVTEVGLSARFDDAMAMTVEILKVTEAFGWDQERDFFMNKRAFVYQYLASWLNPGRPVEGHKVPVVIRMKDGAIKKRQLCVSDLTYREVFGLHREDRDYLAYMRKLKKEKKYDVPDGQDIEGFFTPMTPEAIGQAHGGSLLASITAPIAGFSQGNLVYILGQQEGGVEVVGRNTTGDVIRETINLNKLQIINHEVDGWQRPGETMLEGMRPCFIGGYWVIKTGTWKFEREAGSRFRFIEGAGGYSRVWANMKGNLSNHEAWTTKAVVKKEFSLTEQQLIKSGVKKEEEVGTLVKRINLPCLEMTEEQAQKFFLHRYQILFELLTGRAHEGNKPGQAIIDLDQYYESDSAFISQLIRPIKDLELGVNLVQQKQALRATVMKGEVLNYEFILESRWAREGYEVAKAKEVEGNIEHGHLKQIIDAADAIRKEEIKTLNVGWWGRAAIWLNKVAVYKAINIPSGLMTWGAVSGVNFIASARYGTTFLGLLRDAMVNFGMPQIWATVLPWAVVIPTTYGLSLLTWDKGVMLRIIRAIVKKKAPDFGHFFSKYFDPKKNIEDAYFPAQ